MSRDHSVANPDRMRYTCDGCARTYSGVALGRTPPGWRVELARDLCDLCAASADAAPWTVALPAELRAHFEAMAEAWGATPEEQLARYLAADRGLVDLADEARRRTQPRARRSRA